MKTKDDYLSAYRSARKFAWKRHDEFISQGHTKTELYQDPKYLALVQKEHECFNAALRLQQEENK